MDVNEHRSAQILAALAAAPLDRIRLMKTLFLVWHRTGRPEEGPFHFVPYLYGPCAFDLYGALDALERQGCVVQAPHSTGRWGRYYLTPAAKAAGCSRDIDEVERSDIANTARWAAAVEFEPLLTQVYKEAPDFAQRSVFKQGEGVAT